MFSRRQRGAGVVFGCVDAAATGLGFVSACLVRSVVVPELPPRFPAWPLPAGPLYLFARYLPVLAAIVLIWLAVGYVLGVYRPQELRERRQAVFDPTKQIVAGMLVLAAGLFFVKG